MSLAKIYNYNTPSDYTYDSNLIEVVNGVAKLKSLMPTNCTFYANYDYSINGNAGSGFLTGEASGGASILNGKLNLVFSDVRYVDYTAYKNADSMQVGCLRFKITPNYSNAPVVQHTFFAIIKAESVINNAIFIEHRTNSGLYLSMYNNAGGGSSLGSLGNWLPVAGTEYEFELNWDITAGATRLFINGVQFGATRVQTFTRNDQINILRIGSSYAGTDVSNFKIDSVFVYSTVQHVANYTPGDVITEVYSKSNPIIKTNETTDTQGLVIFSELKEISGSDEIKYILYVDSVKKYFNGTAWVTSDGSYNQANTVDEINGNITSIITAGSVFGYEAHLHSADGNTTPELGAVLLDYLYYDFGTHTVLPPNICTVYGFCYDKLGAALSGVSITVRLENAIAKYRDYLLVADTQRVIVSNAIGYWEINLVNSAYLDGSKYIFTFTYNNQSREYIKHVPDELNKNFAELTD